VVILSLLVYVQQCGYKEKVVYQIMIEHKDEYGDSYMVRSGRISAKLKMLRNRLAKHSKGWILNMNTKQVVVARGFSKQAMKAIQTVGVEVV